MTDTEINLAVKELEQFLVDMEWELLVSGWSWYSTNAAPESFLKLQACGQCLPIANYGCKNTIYSSVYMNQIARFWHDSIHISRNLNFSRDNEIKVSDIQVLKAKEAGLSPVALRILRIDTKDQVIYYYTHGKFVENQREFVLNRLRNS